MFNKQIPTAMVVESIAPAGKRPDEILPMQLGLLDEQTQLTVDSDTYHPDKRYRFIYQPPFKGMNHGEGTPFGGDERSALVPILSQPLGFVDRAHKFADADPDGKPFIGYLGYDSVAACKTIDNLKCNTTYGIQMKVIGKPVRDVFFRNHEEIATFSTDCCDDCTTTERVEKIIEKIHKAIHSQMFYLPKNFVDVEIVKDCCPTETPFTQYNFKEYTLTIQDTGDQKALAVVQRAYPELEVKRVSYKGITSVYSVCKACVETTPDDPNTPDTNEQVWTCTAPTDFTQTGTALLNCDTCPTGFTKVDAAQVFVMTVPKASADVLADVQAVYATATAATLLSETNTDWTAEVVMPAAFDGTVAANTMIQKIGDQSAACVQTTPVTTAWVEGEDYYKIARALKLTIANKECDGTDYLAEMTEAFATRTDIVPGSLAIANAGDCNSEYTLLQYNNECLKNGCDTFGKDGAKFDLFAGFMGFEWLPDGCEGWTFDGDGCPVAPADPEVLDCRVGLKFTGKFIEREDIRNFHDPEAQIEVDPVRVEVTLVKQWNSPFSGEPICQEELLPWTVVQEPKIPQGLGEFAFRTVLHSRFYDNQIFINPNSEMAARWNDTLGYELGVDPKELYHHIDLYHNARPYEEAIMDGQRTREHLCFFTKASNAPLQQELATFLNKTVLYGRGFAELLS